LPGVGYMGLGSANNSFWVMNYNKTETGVYSDTKMYDTTT